MYNDIKYIMNTLWAMYKKFESDFDVKSYTDQAACLCRKYKDNAPMLNFCQNQVISWTPVINLMSEKHRKESAA